MNILRLVGATFLGASLAACGGGGGGSSQTTNDGMAGQQPSNPVAPVAPPAPPAGPTPPAVQGLTIENFVQVSAVAFSSSAFIFDAEGGALIDTTIPGPVNTTAPFPCDSGSAETSLIIQNETVTTGDSVATTFVNCLQSFLDGGADVTNGNINVSITGASGLVMGGSAFELTQLVSFANFSQVETAGEFQGTVTNAVGNVEVNITDTAVVETASLTADSGFSLSASSDSFVFSQDSQQVTQSIDRSNNTFELDSNSRFQLTTSIANGVFVADNTTPYSGVIDSSLRDDEGDIILNPSSGVQTITDGNGAVATIIATSNSSAQISLDLDNNGVPEAINTLNFTELTDIADSIAGINII